MRGQRQNLWIDTHSRAYRQSLQRGVSAVNAAASRDSATEGKHHHLCTVGQILSPWGQGLQHTLRQLRAVSWRLRDQPIVPNLLPGRG